MKKILCIFLAAALTVLSGCAGSRPPELSQRLIIEAVGVDRTAAGFAVTIQALDSPTGPSEATPEDGVTKSYTFYGTTVGEAMAQITPQTGLFPLYSQTRLLALGFETARNSLCEALDFFLREKNTRADMLIAVAEHTAEELITADFGNNRVGADVLENVIRTGRETGAAACVPLYRFVGLALNGIDAACCPLLGVTENRLSGGCLAVNRGTVVFHGTDFGTLIKEEDVFSLCMLTEKCNGAELAVLDEKNAYTLRLTRKNIRIKTLKTAEDIRFSLKIDVMCDIAEVRYSAFTQLDPGHIRDVAETASRLLTEKLSRTLAFCFYENGCDVCRFRQRLRLRYPALYRTLAAQGKLSPADLPCEITCSVAIRRTGKEILRQN